MNIPDHPIQSLPHLRLDLHELRGLHGANFVAESRGVYHPDRTLDVHDLLYNISGRRSVVVGPHRFDLAPGDILLLPAGIRHHAPEGNATAVRSAYIHFSARHEDRVFEGLMKDGNKSHPPEIDVPLHRPCLRDPRLPGLFEEIILLDHSADPMRRFRARVLLSELILILASTEGSRGETSTVDLLLERIDRNPGSEENLDDFATRYGVNRRTLCRQFHLATGKSIHQYRMEARIRSATHTLRVAPQTPIKELSDQLGFADPFHFSRVFKAQMGVSPRGYLKASPSYPG